ncbi:MAG: DUF4340 domain-containing protein [Lysobacteraceae bacterium]
MLGSRRLSILAILAVLAVVVAFWLKSSRQPAEELSASGLLLPTLSNRINQVDQLTISAAGERVATLQNSDDGWVMPERDAYPVAVAELRSLLLVLGDARRVEAKTANPDRYTKLGVDDPLADASATGVRIDIRAGDESMGLIVGGNRPGGNGTYVRLVDDPQSWLTDRNIAIEKRPARWLQRQLTDIAASRIQSVTVEHPADADAKADTVMIEADGQSGFTLANLPKGREAADDYSIEALAGFLADLRFDELAANESGSLPETGVGTAAFRSSDGLIISLRHWTEGEQPARVWASFDVDFDEEQALQAVETAQRQAKVEHAAARLQAAQAAAPEDREGEAVDTNSSAAIEAPLAVTDPEADRRARIAALKMEVAAIRDRVDGRRFELPASKAGNLRKRLDAYLKPLEG